MPAKQKSSSSSASRRRTQESPDGQELLVLELREIYDAESQLARVAPRLAKAVQSERLRNLIEERQSQGERLLKELERALDEMNESPGRKKNVAAEGLINDAREHVQEIEEGPARDAVLIAALQKTEHYCIAAWGTAKSMARALGNETIVQSMDRAVKEGANLDERLTELAESEVNPAVLESAGANGRGRSMPPGGGEVRA